MWNSSMPLTRAELGAAQLFSNGAVAMHYRRAA